MNTNNITPNHKKEADQEIEPKNAVIFLNYYSTAKLYEIKDLCSANNFSVDQIIYNYNLHDARPYKEMIKYVATQKTPPTVFIDSAMRIFPQCVMGSTTLGTLEQMKLVKIHTYSKDISKNYKLTLNANAIDLLTDAAWQVQSIERIYEERQQKRREERKNARKTEIEK
jgi:hypothetical protein